MEKQEKFGLNELDPSVRRFLRKNKVTLGELRKSKDVCEDILNRKPHDSMVLFQMIIESDLSVPVKVLITSYLTRVTMPTTGTEKISEEQLAVLSEDLAKRIRESFGAEVGIDPVDADESPFGTPGIKVTAPNKKTLH